LYEMWNTAQANRMSKVRFKNEEDRIA
jgi:hypothetical protein